MLCGLAADYRSATDMASALGGLRAHQVSAETALTLYLASAGDLESLEQCLMGFELRHRNIPFFKYLSIHIL
jgi:hypothetical protein